MYIVTTTYKGVDYYLQGKSWTTNRKLAHIYFDESAAREGLRIANKLKLKYTIVKVGEQPSF